MTRNAVILPFSERRRVQRRGTTHLGIRDSAGGPTSGPR